MKTTGLSLIELLIAATITVMMLGVVAYGIQSTASSTRVIQTQQLLTEDLRSSGNLISDELSQALHIFPRDTELTLQTGGGSYTISNFRTSDTKWTVGTDPIIAFILPPEDPSKAAVCSSDSSGCLRFVAYYPVPRSVVVSNTVNTPNFIGSDSANGNTWTLYRYVTYLDNLNGDFSKARNSILTASFTAQPAQADLLADYIQPDQGFGADWSNSGSKCRVKETDPNTGAETINRYAPCPTSGSLESVTELVFNLRGQMSKGNLVLVPSGEPLVFRGTPRNLTDLNNN